MALAPSYIPTDEEIERSKKLRKEKYDEEIKDIMNNGFSKKQAEYLYLKFNNIYYDMKTKRY